MRETEGQARADQAAIIPILATCLVCLAACGGNSGSPSTGAGGTSSGQRATSSSGTAPGTTGSAAGTSSAGATGASGTGTSTSTTASGATGTSGAGSSSTGTAGGGTSSAGASGGGSSSTGTSGAPPTGGATTGGSTGAQTGGTTGSTTGGTGGACGVGETCTVLAAGQSYPFAVAVDSSNVYWSSYETIFQTLLEGGSPAPLQDYPPAGTAPLPGRYVTALVVDDTSGAACGSTVGCLYWSTYNAGDPSNVGLVNYAGIGGGGQVYSLEYDEGASADDVIPVALGLALPEVFWAADATAFGTGASYGLLIDQATGSASQSIYSGSVSLSRPAGLALDSTQVYVTDSENGIVVEIAQDSSAASVLASGQGSPTGIAAAGGQLYWTNVETGSCGDGGDCPGALMTLSLPDGGATTLVSNQTNLSGSVATDGTNAYWLVEGTSANGFTDGAVLKVAVGGGTPIVLASSQARPQVLALDATSVYWTNLGTAANGYLDGTVMKATPK